MQEKPSTIGIRIVPSDDVITGLDFLEAANNLLRLVTEVDIAYSGFTGRTVDWALRRLSYASPALVELEAVVRDGRPDNREGIRQAVISGVTALKEAPERPHYFTDQALVSTRGLVSILGERIASVEVFSDGTVVDCDEKITANVRTIMRPGKEMLGTIEGFLQAMDSHAGFRFALFEPVFGRRIDGRLDEPAAPSLRDEVVANFEQRVRISGVLRANLRGEVVGVKAQSITPLRSTKSLTSASEVTGLFDVTNGLSAEDYIRSLRDAG